MFNSSGTCLHLFSEKIETNLPTEFTFPFYYKPHNLSIKAAEEVQTYLKTQTDFEHNFGLDATKKGLKIGKMFGVMVVQTKAGNLGYLAAFSGKLANSNFIAGFVPPIYDTLQNEGFYKQGEAHLNQINQQIETLETSADLQQAQLFLDEQLITYKTKLKNYKLNAKKAKEERHKRRGEAKQQLNKLDYENLSKTLDTESIKWHFGLRDLKQLWETKIEAAKQRLQRIEQPILKLKAERKALSSKLQKQLHEQYQFLNYKGETKDLLAIFKTTNLPQPPAGSGECAAPKLFQYAYKNNLKPIAMAEFWWGISPKSEVRQHQQFYPSCIGKCQPILGFMMQGLKVEANPLIKTTQFKGKLPIVFEDDYLLVVNKPHEFLSVPGKTITDSVQTRMQAYLPNAKGPLLVHRLDMSTSGLLLVAKNEKTHKNLQKQFIERTIKKRYVAILDGILNEKEGEISLPLRLDFNNRPRQLVCFKTGKPAKTKFEIIEIKHGKTKVYFYPITGRTHQLRVHAAHRLGLNTPILGDDLYGKIADRLYLHAQQLEFNHPVTNKTIRVKAEVPF